MIAEVEEFELEWFREDLLDWYAVAGRTFPWRASDTTLYEHVLAEIFLQRTRAETVAPFYERFVEKYSDWNSVAQLSVVELEAELKPIGLAKQRATRISKLARILSQPDYKFSLGKDDLLSLPAIGQYVSYAIQSFTGKYRRPLLDSGMARVIERQFGRRLLADIRYDLWLQEIAQRIVDVENSLVISWALLDLAALTCKTKNPLCGSCPVRRLCKHASGSSNVLSQNY